MTRRLIALGLTVGMLSGFAQNVSAADKTDADTAISRVDPYYTQGQGKRGSLLPSLYVSLAAVQAADIYSTRQAIKAGASEANPMMKSFAGSSGSMLAIKAATTAGTIFFAERLAKKNKAAAIGLMIATNGTLAAVAAHNMRNARKLR
jgi:hypothetical protein